MFTTFHRAPLTHAAVLGLDPRTTRSAHWIGNDPRIKSEGGAVYAEGSGK